MELRRENERLREALTETTLRLAQLKVELERATQVRCRDLRTSCAGDSERQSSGGKGLAPWEVGGLLPLGSGLWLDQE